MTLPENALKYDDRSVCSLQELRQFLADRNIPFRFTRAQSHTKTFYKRDREERRKMTALLRKADDAATIRFFELAPELRDEIYDYYLEGTTRDEALTEDELQNRLRCVSKRFGEEAGDVLKRGTYQFRPRTADKSSALAETVWGTLVMTPARQTTSRSRVRPPSLPTRINGLVMRGPAGIGKSSFRSALPSLWTSPWYSASDTVESPLYSPSALRYMDGEILGAPGEGKSSLKGFNLEDLPSDVTRVSHFPTPEEILLRSFSKMISMGYSVEDLLCLMPAQGLRQQSLQTLEDYMKCNPL